MRHARRSGWTGNRWGTTRHTSPLNDHECRGVLAHEILHVAGGHCFRQGRATLNCWNDACDYAINPIVRQAGMALPARLPRRSALLWAISRGDLRGPHAGGEAEGTGEVWRQTGGERARWATGTRERREHTVSGSRSVFHAVLRRGPPLPGGQRQGGKGSRMAGGHASGCESSPDARANCREG
jgi:hypothetical protein